MTTEMKHMYVTMPKALLDEIDRLVGRAHRNEFIVKVIEEKLARMKAEVGVTNTRKEAA
jgi:metal-responsive CopG/Arc/MetJ family transcriptional regulator